eukprot:scaffold111843_cov32-Tisochrysis_lutea.AAC.4
MPREAHGHEPTEVLAWSPPPSLQSSRPSGHSLSSKRSVTRLGEGVSRSTVENGRSDDRFACLRSWLSMAVCRLRTAIGGWFAAPSSPWMWRDIAGHGDLSGTASTSHASNSISVRDSRIAIVRTLAAAWHNIEVRRPSCSRPASKSAPSSRLV